MPISIPRVIRLFILAAIIAIPCGFLAALTAPLHSPFLLQKFCPEGTQIKVQWDRASYQDPTESTLFVSCHAPDGSGSPLPERLGGRLFGIYYPICLAVIILFQVGLWFRAKFRSRELPSPNQGNTP